MASPESHVGITHLPVELIRHICSVLCPPCVPGQLPYHCRECRSQRPGCITWSRGQRDMSRLSRTSRAFCENVQPMVFLCFSDNSRVQVRSMIRLARTLIARPDLAQHMKYLMYSDPLGQLELSERQFVQDSILQLGLPTVPDYWNVDGDPEYRLLPLELVLAHTPNLEYLRLPLDYDWRFTLLPGLLTTRTEPLLPKLTAIESSQFFIAGDRFDANLDPIEDLAQAAPNLQSLCLPSPNGSYGGAPYPFANLRRLYFQANCMISPEQLTHILKSAPKLEVLALHWDMLCEAYEDDDDRRVTEVWEAVEHRKDSLRELRLDVRTDTEVGVAGRVSLADFERLEVLRVDGHSLEPLWRAWRERNRHAMVHSFLSGMFPPSIREVTFWRLDGAEYKEAMLRFAKMVALGRYPKLERVVMAPSELSDRLASDDEWRNAEVWTALKDELEDVFGKGGVTFELSRGSLYGYWSGGVLD